MVDRPDQRLPRSVNGFPKVQLSKLWNPTDRGVSRTRTARHNIVRLVCISVSVLLGIAISRGEDANVKTVITSHKKGDKSTNQYS